MAVDHLAYIFLCQPLRLSKAFLNDQPPPQGSTMQFLFDLLQPTPRRSGSSAALLLLGIYVFGMWHWHADLARQKATDELREKIVPWVKQQPAKPGGYSWADLERAAVVTPDDAAFLRKQRYEYQPIGPKSIPEDVLFLKRHDVDDERYVYCSSSIGYRRRWPSPGGQRYILDIARPGDPSKRMIQIFPGNAAPPQEYFIDGHYREVLWNPTGRLAVMNVGLEGAKDPITIWHLGNNGSEAVQLPDDFSLEAILSKHAVHVNTSWGMQIVEAKEWRSQDELLVYVQGTGSYVDPRGAKMGFNFIYNVTLKVAGPNKCQVSSFSKRHFAASEFK
jgi:hypothetical protein